MATVNYAQAVDSLTRWQRMRMVNLAIACGAPLSLFSEEKASGNYPDAAKEVSAAGYHRLEFAHPGRSLVDKHFDSIAQTLTTELNVPTFSASTPEGAAGHLLLQIAHAENSSDKSYDGKGNTTAPPADCLLFHLAQLCNAATHSTPTNNNGNDSDDGEQKNAASAGAAASSPSSSFKPWWWNEKYDPSFINMETGDMAEEPVDDIICRPLSLWAENCRFVLANAAARLSALEKRNEQQQQQVAEKNSAAAAASHLLARIHADLSDQRREVTFHISSSGDLSCGSPQALPAPAPCPFGGGASGGFNRSKVQLAQEFRDVTAPTVTMRTAHALSRFLCEKILHITQLVLQRALDAAGSGADRVTAGEAATDSTKRDKVLAALFCYVFSDARRRQANSAQQDNPMGAMMMPPMGGGAGGGMMAMMMPFAAAGGGGSAAAPIFPSSSSSATMDPSVMMALSMLHGAGGRNGAADSATADGGHKEDRAAAVAAMLASLQASAMQQQGAAAASTSAIQQQQQHQQERQAPPPPFPLPLSLLEEAQIVLAGSPLLPPQLGAVRHAVEIAPYLPFVPEPADANDIDNENESMTDEEREELEIEAAMKAMQQPPPTYAGVFSDALLALLQ